jgi:hypothetical protein
MPAVRQVRPRCPPHPATHCPPTHLSSRSCRHSHGRGRSHAHGSCRSHGRSRAHGRCRSHGHCWGHPWEGRPAGAAGLAGAAPVGVAACGAGHAGGAVSLSHSRSCGGRSRCLSRKGGRMNEQWDPAAAGSWRQRGARRPPAVFRSLQPSSAEGRRGRRGGSRGKRRQQAQGRGAAAGHTFTIHSSFSWQALGCSPDCPGQVVLHAASRHSQAWQA